MVGRPRPVSGMSGQSPGNGEALDPKAGGLRTGAEAVPIGYAIVGVDLADRKQMVVVTHHHSRVLARRTGRCTAWDC